MNIAKRRGQKKAIVALARRLNFGPPNNDFPNAKIQKKGSARPIRFVFISRPSIIHEVERVLIGFRPATCVATEPPAGPQARSGVTMPRKMSLPSTTNAARAGNGLTRGKARSNGHGCHVGRSLPTRFVFSFTRSLTISVISHEHWRRPSRSKTGR